MEDLEASPAVASAIGERIAKLELRDDCVILRTSSGGFELRDEKHLCCERRYLTSADDPKAFVNAKLLSVEQREVGRRSDRDLPDEPESSSNEHEVTFLVITTSAGEFVVTAHNSHNGCYGGFRLEARALDKPCESY